jgi:hypothetical protein
LPKYCFIGIYWISNICQYFVYLANIRIEMPKIIENRLIKEFKDKGSFTRTELLDFFRQFEPDLKEGTLAWRIYDLKNRNIIKPLMRGLYTVSFKQKYNPEISQELYKIADKISSRFADIKYCLWETEWLNEFSQHQSGKKMILVEVEKEFVESFYYDLKDNFKNDIYLNPDEKAINFYISESNQPLIIKNLVTRSPIDMRTERKIEVYTPLLEKILVDLFAEEKLFYLYQGGELVHIYENAIKSYTINFTKLFSYARRRKKEQEIKMFLTYHIPHLVKDIIHD